MLPKTKHRKRIEMEKCNELERRWRHPDVYINGKEFWYYAKAHDLTFNVMYPIKETPFIGIDFFSGHNIRRVTVKDFIYNSVKNRLDLFIDE